MLLLHSSSESGSYVGFEGFAEGFVVVVSEVDVEGFRETFAASAAAAGVELRGFLATLSGLGMLLAELRSN